MSSDDPDDFDREEFYSQIAAYEQAESIPLFEILCKSGISLPPPDQLSDAQLPDKLWEIINALSLMRVYFHNTNHLSDQELYAELWQDLLREPAVIMPDNPSYAYHIDLVGSGSEEDLLLYLKYYAEEEERQRWGKEWLADRIPKHEEPSYDRDRRLPQPGDLDEYQVM